MLPIETGGMAMHSSLLLKLTAASILALALPLSAQSAGLNAPAGATVLKAADMEKLMPATVFYRGQTATTQIRNSGGIKFGDGYFIMAAMVDTSGYSAGIVAKYQAYFITEAPIKINGKSLGAGVYGIGFINGNKFLVTDIGAHDVLRVDSVTDPSLKRPTPLQVMADANGGFRLYCGRKYVILTR